jgi:hypothetical protein
MRDKSKKDGIEHRPASNLPADGVDAWYMMQRHRELELRRRRQEAEALLRGYRANAEEIITDFGANFSPTAKNRGRSSFGDPYRICRTSLGGTLSESLSDPASPVNARRQSSMARLEHNWADDESRNPAEEYGVMTNNERTPFPLTRTDFLRNRHLYSGEHYDKSSFGEGGQALYYTEGEYPEQFPMSSREERDYVPRYNNKKASYIDTSESQSRLRDADGENTRMFDPSMDFDFAGEKRMFDPSMDLQDPAKTEAPPNHFSDEAMNVPETIWRDFVSSGKYTDIPSI